MSGTASRGLDARVPVELTNAQRRIRLDTRRLRREAEALLEAAGLEERVLSVLITDDRRMAGLHERWMGRPGPTDVLSFRYNSKGAVRERGLPPSVLGDIAISAETAARRAPRRSPAGTHREIFRYLVHGLLHLMGHDHATPAQRDRMRRARRGLLCRWKRGLPPLGAQGGRPL